MLFSFSLASRKKESNSFSIHPLVHSWARERLTPMIGRAKATASLQMISNNEVKKNRYRPALDTTHPNMLQAGFPVYILHK